MARNTNKNGTGQSANSKTVSELENINLLEKKAMLIILY